MPDERTGREVLTLDDVSVRLSTPDGELAALSGISFGVGEGESVALVGESGCGKSLTALAVTGLLPPKSTVSGDIRLGSRSLLSLPKRARRRLGGKDIGMIFQDPVASLNPVMSIGEQVSEVARLHLGASRRDASKLSAEMLGNVGIPRSRNILKEYPHQLSGGMCQRVSIAMALISRPKLLIADEPTTALDVSIQAEILELLRQVASESGTSLLLITHDLAVVARTCNRVVVMYAGQVVEIGDTEQVLTRPRHPYTAALLRSVPDPEAADLELETIPGSVPLLGQMPSGCRFAPRCDFADGACLDEPPLTSRLGSALRCWHPISGSAFGKAADHHHENGDHRG